MSEKRQVFETWFQRVWTEEDPAAIDELFRADAAAMGLGAHPVQGPAKFRLFQSTLCELITDIAVSIDKTVEQGEWISLAFTFCGVAKSTGEPVKTTASLFGRIEDGQICECYNFFDFMTLWGQLGFKPENTFEQGLSGQKVV